MTKRCIWLKDLQFAYPQQSKQISPLVLNISELEILQGEKVFLYGPSGHGKSTLLNLLAGVLEASNGQIEILDKNLKSFSQSSRDHLRGEHIGYIFQIFKNFF
mgnify:FL=1